MEGVLEENPPEPELLVHLRLVPRRMAEPQNLSRAAAFLAEGGIFTSWLAEQSNGSQALITQLTDRLVWDKEAEDAFWDNFDFRNEAPAPQSLRISRNLQPGRILLNAARARQSGETRLAPTDAINL
ncbi:hypothetical protein AK812_SmicGene20391 [Symbiodinium microadriaticum]|uniref:Uncharacterized protein n=1 Tax=Symbiodinium microadriaticum TaxID=2951 RepID=A0A1Q9DQ79_SYMMI|nr:hypothetical protein AK812_SmicGene20391 [Symbiodinium microadriaticum]